MITTEEELVAALAAGGDIWCDSSVTIPLTAAMHVTVPCRIHGGQFTREAGPAFEVTTSHVEFRGVHITGGGRTFADLMNEAATFADLAALHASYEDMRWMNGTYDGTQKLIWVRGTRHAPLSNIRVHGCTLTRSLGDNVWLDWCTDSTVHHNHITRALYSGVMVVSGDRIDISHNHISDLGLSPGVINVYGIAATDVTNQLADRSRNITITANHVTLVDWEGIDTHGGERVTVVGNIVSGCPRGIAFVTGNDTRQAVPSRCLATGNTVDSAGARRPAREGISLAGRSGLGATGLISGNQVVGYSNPIWTYAWSPALSLVDGNVTA